MKKSLLLIVFIYAFLSSFSQSIGIGTNTPDSSAILDINSNAKGILIPRMDSNARKAIPNTKGLMVYDTTTGSYWFNDGTDWCKTISTKGNEQLVPNGNATGDMLYWDGTKWTILPIGTEGQVLTVCGGLPVWGGCSGTVTISPSNNPYEGNINVYVPTSWLSPYSQIDAEAWTDGGAPFIMRGCLKFDYSSIPTGAIIDSAKLYLYSDPNPINGDKVNASYGTSDACYIQRITSSWVLPTPFTWNSPPTSVTTNEAVIPQSITSSDNEVVDVTTLVQDMQTYGNNGFYIVLQNEVTYNIRQFASSTNANAAIHPALVVSYHR